MRWPWSPPAYAAGSLLLTQEELTCALRTVAPNAVVDDEYEHFLALDEDQLVALVQKAWDPNQITYGSNAPDCPLCYDFAEFAAAAVRLYAIQQGLKSRPAFGTLRYTLSDGSRHAICWAYLSSGKMKYFEPQPTDFPWMDHPEDLKSLDTLEI